MTIFERERERERKEREREREVERGRKRGQNISYFWNLFQPIKIFQSF